MKHHHHQWRLLLLLLVLCLLNCISFTIGNINEDEESNGVHEISFKPPELSEDEENSIHVPDNMQCSACLATAYQITKALKNAESRTQGKPLLESKYIDIMDETCLSAFLNYGIKNLHGVNVLSGEGLEAANTGGVLMGGGKWPNRLRDMCASIVGDIGEDDIYKSYRNREDLGQIFCKDLKNVCRTVNLDDIRSVRSLNEL